MRSRTKTLSLVLVGIILALASLITFTIGWRPILGPKTRRGSDRRFEATTERLARGKYLVEGVTGCFGCHSPADFSKVGAPPVEGKSGAGSAWPDKQLPWLVAPNITPDKDFGAGDWSDDVLARAIREGIGHDGRTLFPVMPYQNYRSMSDEDLASIIVYLRTIPAVRNELPKTNVPFPLNFLIKSIPEPINQPVPTPDQSTPLARGAYIVRMASCTDCHTPQEQGKPIAGLEFAGGFVLDMPTGRVASSNITPDASGISYYDEKLFIHAMREGKIGARLLRPTMPWWFYAKMTDEDLKATFAYLRTLQPVHHRVDNADPPSYCPVCRQSHGLGDQN